MQVRNLTGKTDAEFLQGSIECWQAACARWNGDRGNAAARSAFVYWAIHATSFARRMRSAPPALAGG